MKKKARKKLQMQKKIQIVLMVIQTVCIVLSTIANVISTLR
jgi:hypothetical protein